jgi:hypothetical protein
MDSRQEGCGRPIGYGSPQPLGEMLLLICCRCSNRGLPMQFVIALAVSRASVLSHPVRAVRRTSPGDAAEDGAGHE